MAQPVVHQAQHLAVSQHQTPRWRRQVGQRSVSHVVVPAVQPQTRVRRQVHGAQAFDQHFGGGKTFDHGWRNAVQAFDLGQFLGLLDQAVIHGTLVGEHLCHDDAARMFT